MPLPYTLAQKTRFQIGMIVLQADETLEVDLRRLLPPNAELLVSRVPSGEDLTTESLRSMEDHLTQAASLLPKGASFRVVGYGCTSGTAEIGAERVAELVRAGVRTKTVTEPVTALVQACARFGVSRLGIVSPYVASVSERLLSVLDQAGISNAALASFEEPVEANVVRISEESIVDAALDIGRRKECEAVFLSCTNLRTLDVIPHIEAEVGKPILSSNQVLGWHLCHLAGIAPSAAAPGELFSPR